MARYKFGKCTSCQIGGVVRRKRDNIIFDTNSEKWKGLKNEIEAACNDGYLELIQDSKKTDTKAKDKK